MEAFFYVCFAGHKKEENKNVLLTFFRRLYCCSCLTILLLSFYCCVVFLSLLHSHLLPSDFDFIIHINSCYVCNCCCCCCYFIISLLFIPYFLPASSLFHPSSDLGSVIHITLEKKNIIVNIVAAVAMTKDMVAVVGVLALIVMVIVTIKFIAVVVVVMARL